MLSAPIDVMGYRRSIKDHIKNELKEKLSYYGIDGRDLWADLGHCEDSSVTVEVVRGDVDEVPLDTLERLCEELQSEMESAGHSVSIRVG
jgi:DNA-binding Xre family transcriptional regulator